MAKRMSLITLFISAVMLFAYFVPLAADTVSAQVLDLPGVSSLFDGNRTGDTLFDGSRVATKLQNPVGFNSLRALVVAILDVIVQIAVPLAALFLIYSGYLFVSARGDETKLKEAKSIFMWTLVGIAVLLGAKVLSGIIEETIEQIKR